MKYLLLACALVATCLAAPPKHREDQLEDDGDFGIIRILPPPRPVVLVNPFAGSHNPFKFKSIFDHSSGSEEDDGFFNPFSISRFFPSPLNIFREIMKEIPQPSKDNTKLVNTTSETKVIDGHKVMVNKTVYKDDDSDTLVQVHVIEVSDDSQETGDVTRVPDAEDVTTTLPERNSAENEAEDLRVKRSTYVQQTVQQGDSPWRFKKPENWQPFYWGPNPETLQRLRMDHNNYQNDLSNDIAVNDIKASQYGQQYYALPPDVELFDPNKFNKPNWRNG